jgi:hypothetical protein
MNKFILLILTISFLTNCNISQNKSVDKTERIELIPEPDKAERLKYEALEALKKSSCTLTDPDTSICGIKIRNSETAIPVIGDKDKVDSIDQYHYYSTYERETLTLTQHPGDGKYNISIFKVEKSGKKTMGYRVLNIDTFKSEKGIRIGMSKKQITNKLGFCYAPIDSMNGYIELYYRLEMPKDSKTKLLENNNMPIYYASYKLSNDRLYEFEFGFEYP